jgi:SRSO17 transposase
MDEFGFKIELVLADSLYGESSSFLSNLGKPKLSYVVSIRSNHRVWMPSGQTVRANNQWNLATHNI